MTVFTEAVEELAPLTFHPLVFAGIAATVFVVLGFVTWSFRDVANRHSNKVSRGGSPSGPH